MALRFLAGFKARAHRLTTSGFTLIEMMVVLLIIAFTVTVAIPRIGKNLGTQVKQLTQKIAVISRQVHGMARMKDRTYRLVFSFGTDKTSKIWVESGSGKELAPDPSATPTPKQEKPAEDSAFGADTSVLKKPLEIPKGAQIDDIEIDGIDKPVTQGPVYIYFLPQGLVTRSVIHISNGAKMKWALIINPLTAQTDIREDEVHLKDLDP